MNQLIGVQVSIGVSHNRHNVQPFVHNVVSFWCDPITRMAAFLVGMMPLAVRLEASLRVACACGFFVYHLGT